MPFLRRAAESPTCPAGNFAPLTKSTLMPSNKNDTARIIIVRIANFMNRICFYSANIARIG